MEREHYCSRWDDDQDVLIEAAERLKQASAEFLHGRIQTRLLVVSHRLEQAIPLVHADPVRAVRLLRQMQQEIDDIREHDVRDVSHLLHPSIVKVGLLPALRALVRRFEHGFRIRIRAEEAVYFLDRTDNPQIPEPLRLTCYRVVEEALANASHHGAATTVDISLSLADDNLLVFSVTDDGVGFDTNMYETGFGLRMMTARASRAGGTVTIVSEPGSGTIVEARLPLPTLNASTRGEAHGRGVVGTYRGSRPAPGC